jgi:hypothetical protein
VETEERRVEKNVNRVCNYICTMSSGAIGENSNAQRILLILIFLNGGPSVKEEFCKEQRFSF